MTYGRENEEETLVIATVWHVSSISGAYFLGSATFSGALSARVKVCMYIKNVSTILL